MTESNQVFCRQVTYQLIFRHRATANTFNGAIKAFAALLVSGTHFLFPVVRGSVEMCAELHIRISRNEVSKQTGNGSWFCYSYRICEGNNADVHLHHFCYPLQYNFMAVRV